MFGYVVRNCKPFHNTLVLKSLYFSLVRPHLEFAAVAWCPFNLANINKIERVQMRFVRYLCCKCNLDYSLHDYLYWCHNFGIPTLAQRHTSMMVLFIYKLLRGLISCSELLSLISFNIPTRNVRHRVLFVLPYARVNVFKYSVINKCMHAANEFLLSHFRSLFPAYIKS